jgi:hypothetical protein
MMGTVLLLAGIFGLCLPVVPQVPFLLGSLICFGKASARFNAWLHRNRLYRFAEERLRHTRLAGLVGSTYTQREGG